MSEFKIRAYGKGELALCYFPGSTPHAAANHLRQWIVRCRPLLDGLHEAGHDPRSKMFTPREVRLIVKHLGEP